MPDNTLGNPEQQAFFACYDKSKVGISCDNGKKPGRMGAFQIVARLERNIYLCANQTNKKWMI